MKMLNSTTNITISRFTNSKRALVTFALEIPQASAKYWNTLIPWNLMKGQIIIR